MIEHTITTREARTANKLEERVKKTKASAHQRIMKDGTIQFRLDAENMERLLKIADDRGTGAGILARMWMLERLNIEGLNKETGVNARSWSEQLDQIQAQIPDGRWPELYHRQQGISHAFRRRSAKTSPLPRTR